MTDWFDSRTNPRLPVTGAARTRLREFVAARYEAGAEIGAIAGQIGRGAGLVTALLAESQVTLRPPKPATFRRQRRHGKGQPLTDHQRRQLQTIVTVGYAKRASLGTLAARIGHSQRLVRSLLTDAGVPIRTHIPTNREHGMTHLPAGTTPRKPCPRGSAQHSPTS